MKKLVSRFMAVLMAMTMILSMSMTAFAADTPKGALTVNNTVAGKTLDLYQIFTATKNGDNVAYTLNSAYEGFFQSKITDASTLTGEALSEKHMHMLKIRSEQMEVMAQRLQKISWDGFLDILQL